MAHARRFTATLSTLGPALAIVAAVTSQAQPHAEWRYFGGDKGFTRYSSLDQITRDNVKNLRIAWRRPAVNARLMAKLGVTLQKL